MATKKATTEEKIVKKTTKVPAKTADKKVEVTKTETEVEHTAPITAVETTRKPAGERKTVSVNVVGLDGAVSGKTALPAAIFGDKVNKLLLAQAVRVYLANKRQGTVSTKTRGEVDGSTRKIYRQKGTGRARHGSVRAPIFVKGGVVFGPKPRDYSMDLPKKMRRKALFSALSSKLAEGELKVISGMEDLQPKTKEFVAALGKLGFNQKKVSVLVVTPSDLDNVRRATNNVQGVRSTAANRLNAYDVLKSKQLLLMQDAVSVIEKTFLAKE